MTTSEWISVLALSISSAGFALQARNWFMSGPRLSLSVMADAITIPDDGGGDRLALTVINRGTDPTVLTNMIAYVYSTRWRKFRDKADQAGIVNAPSIPFKLDTNGRWMSMMTYNEKLSAARAKGHLYVGVVSSHSDGHFLINVPPPKKADPVLKNRIASSS